MSSDDTVHPLDQLRAVMTRWPLIALVTVLVAGTALAISLSADTRYDATAKLLVGGQGEPINNLLEGSTSDGSSDPERDVNTGVEVIKAGATVAAVRRTLGLRRSEEALLDQIDVESSSSSSIVSLRARDRSPALAAGIANTFAQSYVDFRLNSARKRYEEAADLAGAQLATLTDAERAAPEGVALQARRRELQIAGALQTGGSEIVRRAALPRERSRPRPVLSTVLALGLGLPLGILSALLLGLADRRLKSEEAIEAVFGLPILGTIPPPPRRVSAHEEHVYREAFGLLAANLRFTALNDRDRVLLVTSSSPVEGKTSVTLGLARAFALLGLRVIAIEADLRRPAFGRYATLGDSPGLAAVLAGDIRVSEALVAIDVETLEPADPHAEDSISFGLLPAGNLPSDPQRALSGASMVMTLRIARALADVVIVDTAPLGTVNDAAALLRLVDSTAIVVRLGATTRDAARRALRVLRNVDVDLAGLVITDAAERRVPDYYTPDAVDSEPVAKRVNVLFGGKSSERSE